ncbi:hypothetical protein [Candidatus Methylomirabilis sp.]|uniref:hypothetical protein n=1 Tax=Candidatus Methylomirabilis sp. TaxID=2032687 RepID=UPI002A6987D8|nr:hypothetical protein [Candidatus Methylomirabilis sp.]
MTGRVPVFIGVVLGVVFMAGCAKHDIHLKTVKVSSSAVYCIFDPSCTVTVTDSITTPIPMKAGGTAFLESRTFAGKPGTPASGLYGYEYRIDLEKAVETMVDVDGIATKHIPCLLSMTLEFGPIVDTLDYDGDGKAGDLIYVVTSSDPGRIGLEHAHGLGNTIVLGFDSPICVGASGGHGNSTYVFGLVSTQPPKSVTATVKETAGLTAAVPSKNENYPRYDVLVRAPQIRTTP